MAFSYYFLSPSMVDDIYRKMAWSQHDFALIAIPYGLHRVHIKSCLVDESVKGNKYLRVNVGNDIDYIDDGNIREYIYPKMYFMPILSDDKPFSMSGLKRLCSIIGADCSGCEDLYDFQKVISNMPYKDFIILVEHQLSLSLVGNKPKLNKRGRPIINRQPVCVNFSSINEDYLFERIGSEPLVRPLSPKEQLILKNYK